MKNYHGGVICIDECVYGYSDSVGWICIELLTSKRMWRKRDALGKGVLGYTDGQLYCIAEEDGMVPLIDASPDSPSRFSSRRLWRKCEAAALLPASWTHPVIVNGKFLRDQDILACFDVKE